MNKAFWHDAAKQKPKDGEVVLSCFHQWNEPKNPRSVCVAVYNAKDDTYCTSDGGHTWPPTHWYPLVEIPPMP